MSQRASDALPASTVRKAAAAAARKSLRSKTKSSKHMSLTQIRAIIQIYDFTFKPPLVNGRRPKLTVAEKDARFQAYLVRMRKEFGREFSADHKPSSEARYIARHTKPLPFLKYKLGRHRNLDPRELTGPQQDYYLEIGGTMDVNQLYAKQQNIDSLEKAAKRNRKRNLKQFQEGNEADEDVSSISHNQNHDHSQKREASVGERDNLLLNASLGDMPPPLDFITMPALIDLSDDPMSDSKKQIENALQALNQGLNKHELEVLTKKKTETFQLCLEKLRAFSQHIRQQLQYQPEMIGCQVGAGEFIHQATVAFDFWVLQHLDDIKEKTGDVEHFGSQVALHRSDTLIWSQFLSEWKFLRCLHRDAFEKV